jgi:hypothetical protein
VTERSETDSPASPSASSNSNLFDPTDDAILDYEEPTNTESSAVETTDAAPPAAPGSVAETAMEEGQAMEEG